MTPRPWTTTELKKGGQLWKEGKTIEQIAQALGRGREAVKHQVKARRDVFPRRRQERGSLKDVVTTKMVITRFVYSAIEKEAERRGTSINVVIREALRERFVGKGRWRPGGEGLQEAEGQEEALLP